MSNDTERLEHEAEEHRSHLDSTLDELRSRMTIGQIVDEFSGYLKEGQGATMAQNFGRQVRDNPLALGLVGAGLAWLAAGPSVRSQGDRLRHDWEDREYDRFEEAFPPDGAEGAGYVPRTDRHPGRGAAGVRKPEPRRDRFGLGNPRRRGVRRRGARVRAWPIAPRLPPRSSVAGAAGSARDRASGAASSTADAARHAGHSASHAAGSAAEAARRGSHDAADAFRSGSASAARGARHAGRGAYRAGQRAERGLIEALQDEPLVFGAIAVAVGAAIGAALPSTRREDELMGEARDRLRDEAWDRGRESLHRAEHVAERAYEAASDTADEKGLKPKSGDGETLAQKAADVGRAATDAAKDEAKTQTRAEAGKDDQSNRDDPAKKTDRS